MVQLFKCKTAGIGNNQVITPVSIASDLSVFQQDGRANLFIGIGFRIPGVYIHRFVCVDICQFVRFNININDSSKVSLLCAGNCRHRFIKILFKSILCRRSGRLYPKLDVNLFRQFCGVEGYGIVFRSKGNRRGNSANNILADLCSIVNIKSCSLSVFSLSDYAAKGGSGYFYCTLGDGCSIAINGGLGFSGRFSFVVIVTACCGGRSKRA